MIGAAVRNANYRETAMTGGYMDENKPEGTPKAERLIGDQRKKTTVMDEAARARCLAGAKNGGRASAARRREQRAKLDRFSATITARVAARRERAPDPIEQSLIDSATALYRIIIPRTTVALFSNRKVNALPLTAAVSGLRSILHELGVLGASQPQSDAVPDPSGELTDIIADITRRKAANGNE